jgi:LDH2 family malate/lactate/ureidoglycolate dehydrogenase
MDDDWHVVQIVRFVTDCLLSVGTRHADAVLLADTLLAADCRGHYSHGMNRIGWWQLFSEWIFFHK